MSLSAGNKVVFLNAMARLQNSVGEVSNNKVHKGRSDLDHTDISNKNVGGRAAGLDIDISEFKSIS